MYKNTIPKYKLLGNVLCCLLFVACTGYGTKLKYNETEVYYTNLVTLEEAEKLGDFLLQKHFADSIPKSVQLTMNESKDRYQFRMVVKEGLDTIPRYINLGKMLAKTISDSVFNGAPVDYHMCDNTFKTKKEIPFER